MQVLRISLPLILFLLLGAHLQAASVDLAWDPDTDTSIAGYKVYYGTTSGQYIGVIDSGNTSTAKVTNLLGGVTYYFAVSSYNAAGKESPLSNEIAVPTVNTDLVSIGLSSGALNTGFVANVYHYQAIVSNSTSSLSITPTAAAPSETLAINGVPAFSGTGSSAVSLAKGNNTLNIVVTAADGATTNTYTIDVYRLNVLEDWRQQHFGTYLNQGAAADMATPLNDGVPNLLKFATGMDPAASGVMPGRLQASDGNLVFSYNRNKAAVSDGTLYEVQWTDDLHSGAWNAAGVTERSLDQGATEQVFTTLPAGGGSSRFVKLVVHHP
jgi:hypothetical protein